MCVCVCVHKQIFLERGRALWLIVRQIFGVCTVHTIVSMHKTRSSTSGLPPYLEVPTSIPCHRTPIRRRALPQCNLAGDLGSLSLLLMRMSGPHVDAIMYCADVFHARPVRRPQRQHKDRHQRKGWRRQTAQITSRRPTTQRQLPVHNLGDYANICIAFRCPTTGMASATLTVNVDAAVNFSFDSSVNSGDGQIDGHS